MLYVMTLDAAEPRARPLMPRALFVGLTTLDLIYRVERLPTANEKIVAEQQLIAAGGPAANAAVTFAHMGGSASLLTAIGAGIPAEVAAAELASHGIDIHDAAPGQPDILPVSSIMVTADTGDRAVISRNAGRHDVDPPGELATLLSGVDLVEVDGHHPRLALAAVEAARTCGLPVLLDAGSWKPVTSELLPLCDLVLASTDFRPPGLSGDSTDVLDYLIDAGVRFAAVSRGASPILWRTCVDRGEVLTVSLSGSVVDTLGAGDVLHGAFAYAAAADPRQERLPDALRLAAEIASASCGMFGTRAWMSGGT